MRKILLIDDDVSIIELVTEFLSQYKYKIVSSTSGRQTTALALSEEPDLIILDINLPDVDGLTILDNLKKQPITTFIPVIMLTGQSSTEFQVSGLLTGADDYITKPFDLKVLHARIVNALRRSLLPTRFKHDQFNLMRYLAQVYSRRGYDIFSKQLDGYPAHPPNWQGFVPDMIISKLIKLRCFNFETTHTLLDETFIERLTSLADCRKNSTGRFAADIVVRTKDNARLVKKLIAEYGLDLAVKLIRRHVRRSA